MCGAEVDFWLGLVWFARDETRSARRDNDQHSPCGAGGYHVSLHISPKQQSEAIRGVDMLMTRCHERVAEKSVRTATLTTRATFISFNGVAAAHKAQSAQSPPATAAVLHPLMQANGSKFSTSGASKPKEERVCAGVPHWGCSGSAADNEAIGSFARG